VTDRGVDRFRRDRLDACRGDPRESSALDSDRDDIVEVERRIPEAAPDRIAPLDLRAMRCHQRLPALREFAGEAPHSRSRREPTLK